MVIPRLLLGRLCNHPVLGAAMDLKLASWWVTLGCGMVSLAAALVFAFTLGRALV